MKLIENLNWRHAVKRMSGKKVNEENISLISEAIRLAPTSMGLQALKVFIISDKELLNEIHAKACPQPQIAECSSLFVFAARNEVTADEINAYMELTANERNIGLESLEDFKKMLMPLIDMPADQYKAWTKNQTYITLGIALAAAAELRVDATPMEGFNPPELDKILRLEEKGFFSTLLMPVGYRDEKNDYLHGAKKVRKASIDMFERI